MQQAGSAHVKCEGSRSALLVTRAWVASMTSYVQPSQGTIVPASLFHPQRDATMPAHLRRTQNRLATKTKLTTS